MRFEEITACGECCTGCQKRQQGLCQGCIESDGRCKEWAQTGRCPIHACAREHKVQFCGVCPEFPCSKLPELIPWNPNIVAHLRALAERVKEDT